MGAPTTTQEPLAVTGLAYRLPGSHDDEHKLWSLLKDGRDTWGKVPHDRYNQDAYHHPDPQHAGSIAAKGGFYMDRNPAAFDAPFFGISPSEASALDPQQRFLLETTFECLESAGVPMERISGSNTGYFAGSFLKDYDTVTSSDPLDIPTYAAVGGSGSFIPNRASWFYNLKGPSLSCDTACSSSLIAFHLACQSIWSGESDQAFAAGASMIMMPNIARALTQMQFLSPDGKCFSFDERGNGYGRGEGIIVLLIKPVSAAIRDGDCIRAVVRASASNQNGRSPGITMPSTEAQAALIRTAYRNAGLDFDTTGYFEAHGTGTAIGDPLEFNAIAQSLVNDSRTSPLIVGSVKSNIGHLEGSAGLAGLMKAVLTVEKGVITPLANFENPNPKLQLDNPNLQLATKLMDWPSAGIRRASINSFGAGGSNAHVVIDDAASFLHTHGLKGFHRTILQSPTPPSDSGVESGDSNDEASTTSNDRGQSPRLYAFSAPEQAGLQRIAATYSEFLKAKIEAGAIEDDERTVLDSQKKSFGPSKLSLEQLAHTLCFNRSVFDWKSFSVSSSATQLSSGLEKGLPTFSKPARTSGIAFVFSGQGGQYARMGIELLRYHLFRQHLLEADSFLQTLGCQWSPIQELGQVDMASKVNGAEYAQPLTTILQTALVDLMRAWGIVPKSVVGHSSGEIAAAYAAGALSKQDAWKVAYFRGLYSAAVSAREPSSRGAMLAVGLSEGEGTAYLERLSEPDVVVACVNSPQSITMSGPEQSIDRIAIKLQEEKIFQSRLHVSNAYHSPEMLSISNDYAKSIGDIKPLEGAGPVMFSSVTGQRVDPKKLNAQYWVDNMLNKVQFTTAVESLLVPTTKGRARRRGKFDVDCFLEIGPHSALKTPVQQIITSEEGKSKQDSKLSYHNVLSRGKHAIVSALEAAGNLWVAGHPVHLAKVNQLGATPHSMPPLTDLPSYPWNHSDKNKYWHETPTARRARLPKEPRNDFLGHLDDDHMSNPQYRNTLRLDEQPWISEHEIQGVVVMPATAFVVMAIEAAVKSVAEGKVAERIELRDKMIQRPLLFQDKSKAIETRVALKPHKIGTRTNNAAWTHVTVSSRSVMDDSWNDHASCYFMIHYKHKVSEVEGTSEEAREAKSYQQAYHAHVEDCTVRYSTSTVYLTLEDCGFKYGPLFKNLEELYCGHSGSTGVIKIPDTKAAMPKNHESPHVIHPIVLDNAMQMLNPALRCSELTDLTMLPTSMESIIIDLDVPNTPGAELKGYTSYQLLGDHELMSQITLGVGHFEKPLVRLKNVHCQEVAGIMDINLSNASQAKPIATELRWKEDIDMLSADALEHVLRAFKSSNSDITEAQAHFIALMELQSFKDPSLSVLELGCTGSELASDTVTRLTDGGRNTHIDRYIMSSSKVKPAWATEAMKHHGGMIDYLNLDLNNLDDEEEPPISSQVDSVVSLSETLQSDNVSSLAKKITKMLKPSGRLSFALEAPEAGLETARQHLDSALEEAGFSGVDAFIRMTDGSTFVTTTKSTEEPPVTPRDIIFVEPSRQDNRVLWLLEKLENSFKAAGHSITRASLEALPSTEGKTILSFVGLGDATLDQMSSSEFHAWRSMMLRHSGLMWVSSGAVRSSKNPLRAMDTGVLRVIRSEEAALRIVQFDFSEEMDVASDQAARLVADAANASLFKDVHEHIVETEICERDGKLFIPRLFTEQAANEAIYYQTHHPAAKKQRIGDSKDVMRMHVGQPGMLDTLRFEEDKKFPTALAPGLAKVRVQATPINFVDIMVAMGMVSADCLGCECAGVVEEVGEGTQIQPGAQVIVMAGNAFATHVVEDESFMQPIPEGLTPEAAASCATVYVTAYIALMDVARIQKGESVLIHAGAGGLGQAAIQLCKMIGAEIFVTCGSLAKKQLLMKKYGIAEDRIFNSRDLSFAKGIMRQTEGRGVDVILNSTSGEALRQTWHCIAQFGRFLEVGKRDIMTNTGLDMQPFIKNASYSGVHINQMFGPARKRVAVAMKKVFDLLNAGEIHEVHPITVMTYSEIEEAFRLVQTGKHTGKVVLKQSDEDIVPVIPSIVEKPQLKPDVTYAIAGGLGGAGQSMVDRMFDCGARNFAFFSRSGDSKPDAKEYLERLRRRGANAKAYRADIANLDALTVAMELMKKEMPPVKGFINAAMFLQDALLAKMTYEQWTIGIAPKVIGHWNFHSLLPSGLDFFVSMSSISAMIGVPGHANYAAANTYEDAFAFWRKSMGEEAISLNLSAVFGVGVMEYSGVEKSAWYDMISLNETEMNCLLGFAMKKTTLKGVPCPTQLTTGVNPAMLNVPSMHWALDPKFRILRRLGSKRSINSDDESAKSKLMDELQQCTTMPAVVKTIEENLVLKLSKSMMCNSEDINTNKPLHSFGVDSLVAVEVRNWIFKELKSEVTVFDIMDPQPLTALCGKIAERSKLISNELKATGKEAE